MVAAVKKIEDNKPKYSLEEPRFERILCWSFQIFCFEVFFAKSAIFSVIGAFYHFLS